MQVHIGKISCRATLYPACLWLTSMLIEWINVGMLNLVSEPHCLTQAIIDASITQFRSQKLLPVPKTSTGESGPPPLNHFLKLIQNATITQHCLCSHRHHHRQPWNFLIKVHLPYMQITITHTSHGVRFDSDRKFWKNTAAHHSING